MLNNPIRADSIFELLQLILNAVTAIAFPIIVLALVYIGFLFVSSQGNPEGIKKAKEYFLWAIVGALIILGAQALALAIQATTEGLGAGVF